MMKKVLLVVGVCCFALIQQVAASEIAVSGNYSSKDGSVVSIEKTTEINQFRITSKGQFSWEGIGYYSTFCNCIKSVFRYTSHREKYGDNPGYHKIEVKDNGETILVTGGWDSIKEFGPNSYSRMK